MTRLPSTTENDARTRIRHRIFEKIAVGMIFRYMLFLSPECRAVQDEIITDHYICDDIRSIDNPRNAGLDNDSHIDQS